MLIYNKVSVSILAGLRPTDIRRHSVSSFVTLWTASSFLKCFVFFLLSVWSSTTETHITDHITFEITQVFGPKKHWLLWWYRMIRFIPTLQKPLKLKSQLLFSLKFSVLAHRAKTTTKMTHCPNTFRLHAHTCTLSHTHLSSHLFPQLNHTVQLKQVEPENHIAFHTEHADSPTTRRASQRCCVVCWLRVAWGRGGRQTSGSWTGGNATVASLIRQWMGGRGTGGRGQSSAALLHLERWSQKWQRDVIAIITHKPGFFLSFQPAEWQEGVRGKLCRQVKRKERP